MRTTAAPEAAIAAASTPTGDSSIRSGPAVSPPPLAADAGENCPSPRRGTHDTTPTMNANTQASANASPNSMIHGTERVPCLGLAGALRAVVAGRLTGVSAGLDRGAGETGVDRCAGRGVES